MAQLSEPARPRVFFEAGALALLKAALGVVVLRSGFHAVSDDDFARIVIAQRFAAAPALDPTGTSWLPFPFWIYGAAHAVFGDSLSVARAVALLLGSASVLLLLAAARVLGLGRLGAVAGAAFGALFPYSAYLGAATVPELPSAALTVFGAASLAARGRVRLLGALALTAACASRYEAWPVALTFALFSLADSRRKRGRVPFAAALLALSFPAAWSLYGLLHHGDPLFFVARVAAYRAALGAQDGAAAAFEKPLALALAEPELMLGLLGGWIALGWRARGGNGGAPGQRLRCGRFAVALLAMLAFLVVGDLRGSAPTHHGERALLPLWLAAALSLGRALELAGRLGPGSRRWPPLAAAAAAVIGLLVVRPRFPREPFAERRDELGIGQRALDLGVQRLAIDAPDFGYFAVQAAAGRAVETHVLDSRDPRRRSSTDPLAGGPEQYADALRTDRFDWLAIARARVRTPERLGAIRAQNARWLLIELRRAAPFR